MPVAAVFATHSPLKDYNSPAADVSERVAQCLSEIRHAVASYEPELVVAIGPDHFNGFFYRLMPSFCIGTSLESIGDWATPTGAIPVASAAAEQCVAYLHNHDVDVSLSHRMEVDHGFSQLLVQLFEWHELPEVLPIFVNCAAPPLPPLKRVAALGAGLGGFLGSHVAAMDKRVLLIGSGGLSHDPPIPQLKNAPAAVRERLIEGGKLSPAAREMRQQKILADASAQISGVSAQRPLNAAWDQSFLEMLVKGRFDALLAQSDPQITVAAGCGGHEIRTWLAARYALDELGAPNPQINFYQAITEWVAGFGIATVGLGLDKKF